MSSWRRWSEDPTVGRALIVAGIIILVVQIVPTGAFRLLGRLWPLAVIAMGVALLLATRRESAR